MYRLNKIIPDGWDSVQFNESFNLLPTLTLSRDDLSFNSDGIGIFNIHYGDIHSTYDYSILNCEKESIPVIIKDGIDINKLTFLEEGDVVIADASEDYEGVGSAIEILNIGQKKLTGGLHTFIARSSNGKISKGFGSYVFKHPWVANELKKIATGSKVYGISKANISTIELILPPLPEQQKIAAILSKWDELIEQQTQLIAAKEKRKKGLMQKLLTGEVRFPGFSGKWERKLLKDVSKVITGSTPPTNDVTNYGDEFYFVSPADLGLTKFILEANKKLSKKGFEKSRMMPKGSVLFTCIGSTIGKCGISERDLTSNQQINAILPSDAHDSDFLYYELISLAPKIKLLAGEQAVPLINKTEFELTAITFPPLEEQQKIALVLSACDEEIQSLKEELEAMQQQKKGLMQQLLTGKIRVKV